MIKMTPFAKRMMIKRLILLVVLLLAFGFAFLAQHFKDMSIFADVSGDNAVMRQVKIVAFGDSLTAGFGILPEESFPAQLEQKLKAEGFDVIVVNAGISGETTAQALARLPSVLEDNPDIVIVEFGANDALKHLSPDDMKNNLDTILAKLEERGVSVLFTGTKLHLNSFGIKNASAFERNYKDLAKKYNVLFYPDFMKDVLDESASLTLADRIHPSAEGVAVIVKNITPYIKQLLKSFAAE